MDTNTAATTSTPTPDASVTNEAAIGDPKPSAATADVTKTEPELVDGAPITPPAKRKIKWGDQEREVTLDEAAKLAEKAWGIEEKARTAAQKADQAEKILHMLQNDYKGFVKQCISSGIPPEKVQELATNILYEQIRLNSLSPEQRELEELKAKQAESEAETKAKEAETQKLEMDKKTQEWSVKFENELKTALDKKALPMSRLTLALTAQYIDAGLADKKEYTVEQVLPFVLRDLKNIHAQTLGSLEGDALLNYLGEDVSNKVAKARVDRYRKGQTSPSAAPKPRENTGSLPEDISKLKGKAYWTALRRLKSEQGIGTFPGQE